MNTEYERDPVCPHCGYKHKDAWEWDFGPGMEGEETFACDRCEKEFFCIRNVQVTYSTKLIPDKKEASHGKD